MPPSSPHARQFLVDDLEVEGFRVELTPDPFQHLLVRLVAWILDSIEEITVAPGTAAIFRWAGTATLYAPGILHLGISFQHLLDLNDVIPIVAKVVGVPELLDARLH